MKKKLLLLDGHSLAYRAFYALPVDNFMTSTGQHTNAIYGFASMVINLIRDEKPTHIVTALTYRAKLLEVRNSPTTKQIARLLLMSFALKFHISMNYLMRCAFHTLNWRDMKQMT